MKKRKPVKVPKAPKDLWRKMLAIITEDPDKLQMDVWHGRGTKNEWGSCIVYEVQGSARKCATTHCQAGFVTYLTKGGYDLETEINRRRLVNSSEKMQEELGISEYVDQASDTVEMAALWILEKSGWSKDVRHGHFFRSNSEALEIEARRENAAKRKKT